MSNQQYVYETMARILREENVDKVFTLMSDATMDLISTIESEWGEEIDVIHTRHEQAAVSMADGYSRSTGNIGVSIVGKGPALAHTGTALINSRKNGSKLLLVVPGAPISKYYDNPVKRFGQKEYLHATIGASDSDRSRYGSTNSVMDLQDTATLPSEFKEAFRRLSVGEGPLAVQIPSDVLNEEMTTGFDPSEYKSAAEITYETPRLPPNENQITEMVDLYLDSDATKPPVIIAGKGAVSANAKDTIERLAKRMNAFLVTTMQSRGVFSNHPFSLGLIGTHGNNLANEYLVKSDFVIAMGCSLNEFTTDQNYLLGADDDNSKLVHVDNNSENIGRYTSTDLGVVGDVKLVSEYMIEKLKSLNIDRDGQFWTPRMKNTISKTPKFMKPENFEKSDKYIDPREVVTYLNDCMPTERIVTVESGHTKFWVLKGIDIPNAGDFIWTLDFSSVGQSIPVGIGAAVGDSERTCFSFCGDAGFMMSLQEIETAARHNIPIVITVINDSALGSEYHDLVHERKYEESAIITSPNLGEVAEKLGAEGHSVRSKEELQSVCDSIQGGIDGPVVIDCKVDRDVEVKYSGQ